MELTPHHRLHLLTSTDWKDAVITLLEPRSPYRPWRGGADEGQKGDTVAFILNTDPAAIVADVGHVGDSLELRQATFRESFGHPNVVDVDTFMTVLGLRMRAATFDGDDAIKVELSLDECRYRGAPQSRFGHNDLARARTLLRFNGRCDGCEQEVDLTGMDARDELFVHTVDQEMPETSIILGYPDWPAVMCRRCRDRMSDGGHASFVDYKFTLNPSCPQCRGHRACEIFYGMPSDHENIPPWEYAGGCCVESVRWRCGICLTEW
jgi:hypothetical protein